MVGRRSRWLHGPLAMVIAVIAVVAVSQSSADGSATSAAAVACGEVAKSEVDALTAAAACAHPVVVGGSQSEYAQVIAQPDGRLTFESAVVPQRVRRADGGWAAVDLKLTTGADGLLRPAASVADVAFSAGGDTPLVSLRGGGRSLRMYWQGSLPRPTVTGDAATYANVLPDVDLVVRATHTGFTHALVVKTAAAAANPRVRRISFTVGGDARVERMPDGSLRAAAGSVLLADAEPALMWDSSPGPSRGLVKGGAQVTASSAFMAGDGARRAAVATRLATDGHLELVPDLSMLSSHDLTYPVYVDPAWSVAKSKWAYATSNGCTNTDYAVARVGLSPDGPCDGARFRSFFEFATTNGAVSLKGKHIGSAYVQMKLKHSWSCTNTWTHMFLTPVINATMKASWSSMTLSTWLDSAEGHANKGSGCSDSPQADMYMNFSGATVTGQLQTAADSSWNSITVGFCACNEKGEWETAQDRWKKFSPADAKLVVDYDSKPGKPTALQVAGVACPASGVLTTGTLTPTFSAVYPDGDSGQTLTGTYEWVEVPAGGIGTVTDTFPTRLPPPAKPSATANGRATTLPVAVVKNKTYAFRVSTVDPAPYSQWSGWSAWCPFTVDTAVPPAPTITPGAVPGPGAPITFTFSTTTTDVVKFRYGWSSPLTTEVAATGTATKTASVTLTVPRYGPNVLWVQGIDTVGNLGNLGSREVTVVRPAPPVARWGLETYPGQTRANALEDKQPSLSLNTPLTATALTWSDGIRLVGGQTAHFDGTSSFAATSVPAVNTAGSFSVAAWLRVDSYIGCTNLSAVAGISGPASAFILEYDCSADRYRMRVADKEGGVLADAASTTSTAMRRWTHVAGVWDAPERKVKLYVDGALVSSVTPPANWLTARGSGFAATGPVAVGRSRNVGLDQSYFKGEIADVQLFDRALVDQDFTGRVAGSGPGADEPGILAPIEVGRWDFELARPCYVQDLVNTCDAGDRTLFGRWLASSRGASVGAGNRGNGLLLDGYFFPEENPEPWQATQEFARSAVKTGVTPPDADGNQHTIWQDRPVLRTDQSFTVSAWVRLDRTDQFQTIVATDGTVNSGFYLYYGTDGGGLWKLKMLKDVATPDAGDGSTIVGAPAVDAAESWHHLVGVVDVGRRQLRLYVDGDLASTGPLNAAWQPWQAAGPLTVGRGWNNTNRLFGAVDDIGVYQGALTDAQVNTLYKSQAS